MNTSFVNFKFITSITNLSRRIFIEKNYLQKSINVKFHSNKSVVKPVIQNKLINIKKNVIPFSTLKGIQENISALQTKKRPVRKKRLVSEEEDIKDPGLFSVLAFSTAEEYNLERLIDGLKKQDLYVPKNFMNYNEPLSDVVHAVAKYQVENEPREIYFFREGSVILWNISELESSNVLSFIRQFEIDRYSEQMVQEESEYMSYKYKDMGNTVLQGGEFVFSLLGQTNLEKYTFSNAMALSVKLGIWEASLDRYVDSIEFVTEDLKRGKKIRMSQEEVLRKHGELLALRHLINLSSDLLDVPDFYWERENLEILYSQTCGYFSIPRRTKVMNDKLNHCLELIELLSSHLSDRHHIRLEWMIIILIMVEVCFETLHYVERIIE